MHYQNDSRDPETDTKRTEHFRNLLVCWAISSDITNENYTAVCFHWRVIVPHKYSIVQLQKLNQHIFCRQPEHIVVAFLRFTLVNSLPLTSSMLR